MVDNINGARAPSAQALKQEKSPNQQTELTKSFEKLANKPVVMAPPKQGLNKLQDAVKFSKDALESVKKLSESDTSESGSVEESYSVDSPQRSQTSEIAQLAKDLDSLKADIKALFESLKEKTDQVTVVDSNLEASKATPTDLEKVVSVAKEAGSEIRFKPKDALSAHSNKINPQSVERLLSGEIVSA